MNATEQSERRPGRAAFVIALLLAGLGALMIWDASRIPNPRGYAGIGPADLPRLIGAGILALAVWTLLAPRGDFAAPPRQEPAPVLWILAGLALQVTLLRTAGFTLASGLLFFCTAAGFGERRYALALGAGLLLAFAVYGVFDGLLKLNLPGGPVERWVYGG